MAELATSVASSLEDAQALYCTGESLLWEGLVLPGVGWGEWALALSSLWQLRPMHFLLLCGRKKLESGGRLWLRVFEVVGAQRSSAHPPLGPSRGQWSPVTLRCLHGCAPTCLSVKDPPGVADTDRPADVVLPVVRPPQPCFNTSLWPSFFIFNHERPTIKWPGWGVGNDPTPGQRV